MKVREEYMEMHEEAVSFLEREILSLPPYLIPLY